MEDIAGTCSGRKTNCFSLPIHPRVLGIGVSLGQRQAAPSNWGRECGDVLPRRREPRDPLRATRLSGQGRELAWKREDSAGGRGYSVGVVGGARWVGRGYGMGVVRGAVGGAWLKDLGDTHHFLQFPHLQELVGVRPEPGFVCQASGKASLVGLGLGFADPWDCCYGSGPFPGSAHKVQGPQEGSKEHPLAKERV